MAVSRAKKAKNEQDLLLYVQKGTFYRIPLQALEQFKLDEKQAEGYVKSQEKYFRAGTRIPTCPATRPVLIPPIPGCQAIRPIWLPPIPGCASTRLVWFPFPSPGTGSAPDPRIKRSWKRDSRQ